MVPPCPGSLQVFATDLSKDAIESARRGSYPAAITGELSAERLDVLSRAKFSVRLARAGLAPVSRVSGLRKLVVVVAPATTTIMGLPRHTPVAPT